MNQRQRILDYLESGKTLTRINSWEELGILEAPARIHELKAAGHDIRTKTVEVTNRYGEIVRIAEWSMAEKPNVVPLKKRDTETLFNIGKAIVSMYHQG